jgi:hypothetical protein
MVHDFAWAADKNYLHDVVTGPNDVAIHFLYKIIQLLSKTGKVAANDGESNGFFNKMLETILTNNSFIQGGDGGMEYAMCTLMLGNGTLEGIFGTATHELDTLGSSMF